VRSTTLLVLVALVLCPGLAAQIPGLSFQSVGNAATNGLSLPIYVCAPPGDLTRLFVVQKGGLIKVRTPANAAGVWGTFLNISTLISTGSEQGLLGMAFHPNYATNGYFFVNYTNTSGNTVIRRYTRSAGNPDLADQASGLTFLTITQPEANHNGGTIQFGPDGYLYIGMGDGGGGNDQHGTMGNGQDLNTLLGKMLRIDVDVPNGAIPYSSPPTNPFFGATAGLDEIWAYGLRNPFRFSFDRLTGDLWIGDVGQDTQEEINFQPATNAAGQHGGRNYGWRCREGNFCTGLSGCTCTGPTLANPVHVFSTQIAGSVAVMGGVVYRGCAIPQLRGHYIFGEHGTGSVWRMTYNGSTATTPVALPSVSSVAGFGEDAAGELYACSRSGNTLYKLVPQATQMVGVTSYGTGTPGCSGASVLSLGCSPTNLNPGLTINSTNGNPSTGAIGIIGSTQLPAGSDPFGIGCEVLVSTAAQDYFLFYPTVGANGLTSFPMPIPYVPSLVGVTFYAQEFFNWSQCSPSPFGWSSTNGLAITIQP
jgi:glucose/arabinose dehydrogenase